MAKTKSAAPEAEPVEPSTDSAPEEAAPTESKSEQRRKAVQTDPVTVKYLDHAGNPIERTFSKDVHGDNFAELAEEFKATNATRLIA
jgi:hypothetical protein